MRKRVWVVVLAAVTAWSACSDPAGPKPGDTRPPAELTIVRQAATALPLQAYQASFWAVRGTSITLEIDYASAIPGEPGEDFLRLDMPGDALLRRPDGSLIQRGDSVLITVSIDPQLVLFRFEPSGLQFDPDHPVRLRVDYARTDDDLNEDGVVDQDDESIRLTWLGVWRQETAGAPWVRLRATNYDDFEEFEALLVGFSNYVLAW